MHLAGSNPAAAAALSKAIPTFFGAGNPATNPPTWITGGGLPTIWSFAPWTNREDLYAWQDDYSKVIKTEPILVTGSEGQAVLAGLGTIRDEMKEFILSYTNSLTNR